MNRYVSPLPTADPDVQIIYRAAPYIQYKQIRLNDFKLDLMEVRRIKI